MRVERHIIDLEDIADIIVNFLKMHLRDVQNQQELIEAAYRELLAQVLYAYSEDPQETELRLIALPNMGHFNHLPILSHPEVYDRLVDLTRYIGQRLYQIVVRECLVEPNTRFFFDSASYTYLVLIKQVG